MKIKYLTIIVATLSMCLLGYFYYLKKLTPSYNFNINGVDLSNHFNGELDWSKLGKYNDFVILRAVRAVDINKNKSAVTWNSVADKKFQKNFQDKFL